MLARMVFMEVLGLPAELVSPMVPAEAPQGGVKVGLGVKEKVGVPLSVEVLLGVRVMVRVGPNRRRGMERFPRHAHLFGLQ